MCGLVRAVLEKGRDWEMQATGRERLAHRTLTALGVLWLIPSIVVTLLRLVTGHDLVGESWPLWLLWFGSFAVLLGLQFIYFRREHAAMWREHVGQNPGFLNNLRWRWVRPHVAVWFVASGIVFLLLGAPFVCWGVSTLYR